jgi:hypothetical protein
MSLGQKTDVASFIPAIKINAKEGTAVLLNRDYRDGQWGNVEVDVSEDFEAIIDMEHARVGWILINRGAPPDTVMVPVGADKGDPPSEAHREGVQVRMLMSEKIDGSPRELLNTSDAVWYAVSELHDAYEDGVADHPGQLPVVRIVGWTERPTKQGSSYAPQFQIVGWVPRPMEIVIPPDAPLPPPATKLRPALKATAPVRDRSDEIPF